MRISHIRKWLQAFTVQGALRLNCQAASTTVPAMKKAIILVSALSIVVMALVSCASDSDVNPYQIGGDTPSHDVRAVPPMPDHVTGGLHDL